MSKAVDALVRASGHTKADASLILDAMVRNDQEAGLYDPPGSEEMRKLINDQDALLRHIEVEIDAILRGDHSGWDQAMSALRDDIRKELP